MSTKTTDTNNINYDPGAMGVYSGLQPSIGGTLNQFMQNPLTSTFFNQRVGMGANQINAMGATQMQNLLSNFRTSGMGGNTTNPFLQSMIARQGRATSGLLSNNFMNQLFNANQMQLGATGMAQAYNPLMTGSKSTQQQSGLGTWLPQLLGTLGGAAMGGLTGGMGGSVMGSLMSPGGSFGSATPPSLSSVGAFPAGAGPFGVSTFPPGIFAGMPGFGG